MTPGPKMSVQDILQELRELGVGGTLFRAGWELKNRSGLTRLLEAREALRGEHDEVALRVGSDLFTDAAQISDVMADRVTLGARETLRRTADQALLGRILCFGRWRAEFGPPLDWQLNPVTSRRWPADLHWTRAIRDPTVGDIKLTWEVARFPHAYHLARAAAFHSQNSSTYAQGLEEQLERFVSDNPRGRGVHWSSGQEIAFRLLAWLFAWDVLLKRDDRVGTGASRLVGRALLEGAAHVEQHIDYARRAVHNNHLLSEALLLYAAGTLLPSSRSASRRRELGRSLLETQADAQFYPDGAYIQNSHNYHRLALQDLLWAVTLARSAGEPPARSWIDALGRSVDFLVAHQCPQTGRLPNYGANDGSLPSLLSTCDFTDFRPTLQAASLAARGERLYEPGPWDEEAAWWLGAEALSATLRPPDRVSIGFHHSGYHVLRGDPSPSTFCALRCGSILDRFSQIDMMHMDVWWRGHNVLVDGGSYLYNGPPEWHNHFMTTASHNTMTVDGLDQMRHHRRFKCLYWTRAETLELEDGPQLAVCTGEHYGYMRHPGRCVHRRSVLMIKDEAWVVVDRVAGEGEHLVRLHWLAGDFPHQYHEETGTLTLETPAGPFFVGVKGESGEPVSGDVARGQENPPRGWQSRYYGERVPVPSLAVSIRATLPAVLITVLSAGGEATLTLEDGCWCLETATRSVRFSVSEGRIIDAQVVPSSSTNGERSKG